jgi:hypothetical protein
MSVNGTIIAALKKFNYPCKPDIYTGTEKRYFTFNCADDRGTDFGDNKPGGNVLSMQVHYVLPWKDGTKEINYLKEKKEIRKALFEAGFTYPRVTVLLDKTNNIRHLVYECEIEEKMED